MNRISRNIPQRLAGPGEVFDLLKSIGNVVGLKDQIAYDTNILNFGSGCWKFNCQDTKGLYIPMVSETRNFDLGNFQVQAVKEINLVPYLAAGLLLFFIMK